MTPNAKKAHDTTSKILRYLATQKEPRGLLDISLSCGISKTTARKYIQAARVREPKLFAKCLPGEGKGGVYEVWLLSTESDKRVSLHLSTMRRNGTVDEIIRAVATATLSPEAAKLVAGEVFPLLHSIKI